MTAWIVAVLGLLAGWLVTIAAQRITRSPSTSRWWVRCAAALSTGGLCGLGWYHLATWPAMLGWCWACLLACALAITDLGCRRLPFALVGALVGGEIAVMVGVAVRDARWDRLVFACCSALAVLALATALQMWLPAHTGGGDTALYGELALYLGWFGWEELLRGLLMATGLTAMVGLVLAAWHRDTHRSFPAGPSLLAGSLLSIVAR